MVGSGKELVASEAVDAEAKCENVSSATTSSRGVSDLSDVVPSEIDILLSSLKAVKGLVSDSCLDIGAEGRIESPVFWKSDFSIFVGDSGSVGGGLFEEDITFSTAENLSGSGVLLLEDSSLSLVTSTMTGPCALSSDIGGIAPAFSSTGD